MALNGQRIDRYQLLHIIGSGGMGDVYLAEDTRIQQQVAIKIIQAETSLYITGDAAEDTARHFRREAQAIARLDHPNILPLFGYGEEQLNTITLIYLVMPYRPEGSLLDWTRQHSEGQLLPIESVAHFIQQAASALQHAHDHNIIHQDVKPSNFLVRARKETPNLPDVLLADFGIARLITATSSTSQSIRGTPTYMAPEQWEGQPVPASDQYALAIMAYEMLAGQPPFRGRMEQIMHNHFATPPKPPSAYHTRISPAIDSVILRALTKKPEERFLAIADFADAFQQALLHQDRDAQTVLSVLANDQPTFVKPTLLAQQVLVEQTFPADNTLPATPKRKRSIPPSIQAAETILPAPTPVLLASETVLPVPVQAEAFALPSLSPPIVARSRVLAPINKRLLLIALIIFVILGSTSLLFYSTLNKAVQANGLSSAILRSADATPSHHAQSSPTHGGTAIAGITFTSATATAVSQATAIAITNANTTATTATNNDNENATATAIAITNARATAVAINNANATATAIVITDGNATATVSAGATATASVPPQEVVIVPFVNGTSGVQTTHSYHGTITITISGIGQASASQYSDAFYIYTDSAGNPITPVHPTQYYNWTLWINGGPAGNFVSPIPPYNPSHVYTFTLNAPGGPLNFAVGDTYTSDNTGAYKVTIA